MLFEIFILTQVLAVGAFLLAWFSKNPLLWSVSVILFGIQMITGFNIEYNIITILDSGIVQQTVSYSSVIAYVNMLFFSLSLLMFFWDIFSERNL